MRFLLWGHLRWARACSRRGGGGPVEPYHLPECRRTPENASPAKPSIHGAWNYSRTRTDSQLLGISSYSTTWHVGDKLKRWPAAERKSQGRAVFCRSAMDAAIGVITQARGGVGGRATRRGPIRNGKDRIQVAYCPRSRRFWVRTKVLRAQAQNGLCIFVG